MIQVLCSTVLDCLSHNLVFPFCRRQPCRDAIDLLCCATWFEQKMSPLPFFSKLTPSLKIINGNFLTIWAVLVQGSVELKIVWKFSKGPMLLSAECPRRQYCWGRRVVPTPQLLWHWRKLVLMLKPKSGTKFPKIVRIGNIWTQQRSRLIYGSCWETSMAEILIAQVAFIVETRLNPWTMACLILHDESGKRGKRRREWSIQNVW